MIERFWFRYYIYFVILLLFGLLFVDTMIFTGFMLVFVEIAVQFEILKDELKKRGYK